MLLFLPENNFQSFQSCMLSLWNRTYKIFLVLLNEFHSYWLSSIFFRIKTEILVTPIVIEYTFNCVWFGRSLPTILEIDMIVNHCNFKNYFGYFSRHLSTKSGLTNKNFSIQKLDVMIWVSEKFPEHRIPEILIFEKLWSIWL